MSNANIKTKLVKWGFAGLALAGAAAGLYTAATLNFTYSGGERVGFVEKISRRGWVCKTNEGSLAMVNLPGQQAEKFSFTVRSDQLVREIEAVAGHKVALSYEEHRGIPSSCFGDTQYFVVGVRKLD